MSKKTRSKKLWAALLLLCVINCSSVYRCGAQSSTAKERTSADPNAPGIGKYLPAEDYVISKFHDHDIVFLGEMHSVRQNLEFLQRLIPRLYGAGIFNLAYEFSSYRDQPRIDQLLNADTYNENLALELLWKCCDLKWVTQEYADVFKAAWQVNHALPKGARRFRIVGMERSYTEADGTALPKGSSTNGLRDGHSLLNHFDSDNFFWAQVIEKEILSAHEKGLVYSGVGHAYTKFYHQRGEDNGVTVGNFINNAIGSRAFNINIHGSASDGRVELAQRIDKILSSLPIETRAIGFDTGQSRLGQLQVKANGYLLGRAKSSGFTLADITDGYAFLAPIDEWKPVTFRGDFINLTNFKRIETRWREDRPRDRAYTLEELKSLSAAAIRNQFLYQQGRLPPTSK
jgi:hypothetical protein